MISLVLEPLINWYFFNFYVLKKAQWVLLIIAPYAWAHFLNIAFKGSCPGWPAKKIDFSFAMLSFSLRVGKSRSGSL